MIPTRRAAVHACRRSRPFARGFTLIEVLVVVVILGILAAVVVPQLMGRPDEARVVRARSDLGAIATALDMYRLDNFDYPSTDQGLEALVRQPPGVEHWRSGGYLQSVPKDPWGREYLYLKPGAHGAFDVWTQGADGRSGGEGIDADLGNWDR
ncbi:MAG: type II secretion system major pseudopilin GspG [Xanthomonadaceae bacterium]|nr:type II secretion system major pseudopilin GspG [Xanthomonadaceae bacterium]